MRDDIRRHDRIRQYQLATDLKPARDLVSNALESLADAILQVQRELKALQDRKLLSWSAALLSLNHQQLALITLATLLNSIYQSEFENGVAPLRVPVAFENRTLSPTAPIEPILVGIYEHGVGMVDSLVCHEVQPVRRHLVSRIEECKEGAGWRGK